MEHKGHTKHVSILARGKNTAYRCVEIKRFVEKPSKEIAQKFIKNKCFTWNSGIFIFKASVIIKELLNFEPDLIHYCKQSLLEAKKDLDFLRIEKNNFEKCSNVAIDVAVMERTKLGTVIPLKAGWSDIGSWNSLWEKSDKDKNGNTKKGKVVCKQKGITLDKANDKKNEF